MARYYLIEVSDVPTTMFERIQNEGMKPVKFILEKRFLFFCKKIVEKTIMVKYNWNPKSLKKGREIILN